MLSQTNAEIIQSILIFAYLIGDVATTVINRRKPIRATTVQALETLWLLIAFSNVAITLYLIINWPQYFVHSFNFVLAIAIAIFGCFNAKWEVQHARD